MSLERVFVICINGSFCFVLSLLTASFPFLPVFCPFSSCLPVFLLRLPPSKTKTLNVITLIRYQKTKT